MTKTLSTKPHPEIVKFKHKQKHPDPYYQREPKLVIKSASEEIFPEAFIFIDHLLKGLEKAEATIRVKESQTEVYYKHYVFSLIFKIPAAKITITPDPKERWSYKTYKYVSKGILSIELGRNESWQPNHPRLKTITQREKESLEDLLKRLFLTMFSLAPVIDKLKQERLVKEEHERIQVEERARIKEQHDNELAKTEKLIRSSLHFHMYKLMKDYIEVELDADSAEFTWALDKANWIKDIDGDSDLILNERDKMQLVKILFNELSK